MKNTKQSQATPDLFLGIDVGKTDLYCHTITSREASSARFDNTEEGIDKLITWLRKLADPSVISACLEHKLLPKLFPGLYAKIISNYFPNYFPDYMQQIISRKLFPGLYAKFILKP